MLNVSLAVSLVSWLYFCSDIELSAFGCYSFLSSLSFLTFVLNFIGLLEIVLYCLLFSSSCRLVEVAGSKSL